MMARYGVAGADELIQTFRELGKTPTAAQRRKARFAALEPIKAEAAANLDRNRSVVTGALKAALTITDSDEKPNRSVLGIKKGIINGQSPSSTAHLVEFGTRPHFQPNRFGGIMHPGARPKPFMRPAAETAMGKAKDAYAESLIEQVVEAAARVASRRPRR